MILPPIIKGDHKKALAWLPYAKRFGWWVKKNLSKYTHISRQPTSTVTVTIKKYGRYIQPYITAIRAVLPAGFVVTPRTGVAKVAFGDESNHNLVNHAEILAYRPATPYIADSGYQPPYDTETGVGADYTDELEFFEQIGGHQRVQWFPRYEGNPSYRFFSPTIDDIDAFTTFDTRIESVPTADWKGPENIVLGWYSSGAWTIYYNGLASWSAPGIVRGAAIKKIESDNGDYWDLYAVVKTAIGSDFGNFGEIWKRRADARDINANELAVHDEITKIMLADEKLPFIIYAGSYNPAREIAEAKASGESEPTLATVLVKTTDTNATLMPVSGKFAHTAISGETAIDIATAVSASAKAAYDDDKGGFLWMSIGSSVRDNGDTEYIFVHWFSWHGIHDNNAWTQVGTFRPRDDITEGWIQRFNGKLSFNWRCDELAVPTEEVDSSLEYTGNHLLIYSISDDDGVALKSKSLGNHASNGSKNNFSTTFQNPQYVDAEYSGNTLKTLAMNTSHLMFTGAGFEGNFNRWVSFTYLFPWRTEGFESSWRYIEQFDLRHNKLVWTQISAAGVQTYFDSGDGVDELIYTSSVPIIETESNTAWFRIGGSTNSIRLATLPNGITLLSAVLSANPIGIMADYQAQFPTLSWSGPGNDFIFIASGVSQIYTFSDVSGPNAISFFEPWPNFTTEYPFAIAREPEVATVNILTNNEAPNEILRLPSAGTGQLTTLLPIGVYGFSDGSDPLNIISIDT